VALRDAAKIPFNSVLMRRLLIASHAVEGGAPLAAAFRDAGFPPRVCEMLATAAQADTLPQTCQFLADIYASRHGRVAILVRSVAQVFVTLLLGCVVYAVVSPIMISLVQLVDAMIEANRGGLL
jgi:type II secretory pathway component PulF